MFVITGVRFAIMCYFLLFLVSFEPGEPLKLYPRLFDQNKCILQGSALPLRVT